MKKVFLILILIFCLVLPLNAVRENEPHDAYWWETSSDSYKLGYISGYVNGMSLILQRLSGFQMPDSLYLKYSKSPDKYWTVNWAFSIIFWDHELYELTYGQLSEGLNEFYKDYRNKKILFDDAIQIVKLELRGESNERIEEHKRWQRVRTSRQTMSDSVFIDKYFEHLRILDSLEKK